MRISYRIITTAIDIATAITKPPISAIFELSTDDFSENKIKRNLSKKEGHG